MNGVREVPRDDLEQSAVGEGGTLPLGQRGPRRGGRVGSQLQDGFNVISNQGSEIGSRP